MEGVGIAIIQLPCKNASYETTESRVSRFYYQKRKEPDVKDIPLIKRSLEDCYCFSS